MIRCVRVCMFVYNRCTTDARVLREASSLRAAGHDVTIIAVLDPTTTGYERLPDGVEILRIDRRPVHYRLAWWVRGRRRAARLGVRRAARRAVRRALRAARPVATRPAGRALADVAAARGVDKADLAHLMLVPLVPIGAALAATSTAARRLLYTAHKPLMYADFWGRAYRVARHGGFAAFHAHDLNTLPAAALLARATRAPLVYDSHELYPEVSVLSPLERRVWRAVEPRLIVRADRVLTVCDSIADVLARRYRVARPTVILNCPPSAPLTDRSTSPLRAAAGLEGERDVAIVLYQGGFAPNRGLPELVRAMRGLDGALLVLMGWGRLEDELARLVRTERLQDKVRILPPVHRDVLHIWTAGADVGVIPYQPVGLNNTLSTPNKLFEYLAAGVPIVASRLPEIARIVDGHAIGVTFARVDPDEIAAALSAVLGDPPLRAAMRAHALAIRDAYTWERQAERLVGIYAALAADAAGSTAPRRTATLA